MELETDAQLCRKAQGGDRDALSALVKRHYALVVELSKRRQPHFSYDQDDLIQEGLIALTRAAKKFDPTRNTKFSTYAWWSVSNRLNSYIRVQKTESGRATSLDNPDSQQSRPENDPEPVEDCREYLALLSPIEQSILARFYGLDSSPMTTKQLAAQYHLSPSQVHSIIRQALAKL